MMLLLFAVSHSKGQSVFSIDALQQGAAISPSLYGLFFEEINHAGDGGLYAELIRNRSFEDNEVQPESWEAVGSATIALTQDCLLNSAQHYALCIIATAPGTGVQNTGYWGIHAVKGRTYRLSFWVRSASGYKGGITAGLYTAFGQPIGEARLYGITDKWKQFTARITADKDDESAVFRLTLQQTGDLDIDVVSLFPPTFKNRPNGLRPDLAQMLLDLKPAFVRFPGGCYVEGENAIKNAFRWKTTLGPIHERPGHGNYTWGYRSTDGLGFHEYLQMCEDLEADALFVVNIGLGHNYVVPMDSLQPLVQDMLDALEYANGPATSFYGRIRARNGHPAPFRIRYVELGNENYQADSDARSENYADRYAIFRKAILEKYPEMKIIGNVEAWGTDHPSWRNSHPVDFLDEHYYKSHTWMLDNFTKYDHYPRPGHAIYNGEYAANAPGTYGRNGTIESALGEAVYMMGMERNADICRMASFAPIFTHESDRAWDYDMIHHTASRSFGTPSYYVQQLFAHNKGDQVVLIEEKDNLLPISLSGRAGVGTWLTAAQFSDFAILDGEGLFVAKESYSADLDRWEPMGGMWQQAKQAYCQSDEKQQLGKSFYVQPVALDRYEITVNARKQSGQEGFLLLFAYGDEQNYCWWNIGGWGNTASALEVSVGGSHTIYDRRPFSVEPGRTYQIRLQVDGGHIVGSIDGREMLNVVLPSRRAVYANASLAKEGSELIVKLVNPVGTPCSVRIDLAHFPVAEGYMQQLKSAHSTDENTLEEPRKVVPTAMEPIQVEGAQISFTLPPYSLNILRLTKIKESLP
ncbi:MAG: carbohydrate binding domain-containing protein [Bacteroidaceae bacterium]|nr:carbohydrate binding domain-containing protein [Bacteroidaceae bacterium]